MKNHSLYIFIKIHENNFFLVYHYDCLYARIFGS